MVNWSIEQFFALEDLGTMDFKTQKFWDAVRQPNCFLSIVKKGSSKQNSQTFSEN